MRVALFGETVRALPLPPNEVMRILLAIQLAIWGVSGISLVLLAVLDLKTSRDADSLLLLLWTAGTLLFAGFVNWTTNGRSILPLVVPAGILIARQMESRSHPQSSRPLPWTVLPEDAICFPSGERSE